MITLTRIADTYILIIHHTSNKSKPQFLELYKIAGSRNSVAIIRQDIRLTLYSIERNYQLQTIYVSPKSQTFLQSGIYMVLCTSDLPGKNYSHQGL